ncbi:M48 family metalloprotease [Rubricoccus marinus]|uniref:Peptidase M48 domain-containing protein n=1 Tax=Rubricoccus marinus TaxID=716817 RepID=A0A259U3B6_9BACT|nr:M48 family metalloprotease [Rubricoccus marinus]OZC04442.1 hypothetical protein BSZ36_16505 [Rubricoccus marinus]
MRLFVFALVFAAIPGCTCNPNSVNRGDLNLVSLDDEWELGRQLAAEVDAQVAPLADAEVEAYADAMGASLVAETELSDRAWTFTVIEDPAVNAFALPGGHVYIHSGLVAAAESEAELASVVAHEVAHVVARHSTERMVKAQGLSVVAGLVLGDDPGMIREIVAELIGQGVLARFSRTDETEADALGLRFMAEADYDPDGMAAMFETLLALRQRQPVLFERWFGTHPLSEDRVEAARAGAAEWDGSGWGGDPARFEAARRRVLARTPAAPLAM